MKLKFDETIILPKYSKEYITALKVLMLNEILMMRKVYPKNKNYWKWGSCEIDNLSNSNNLCFCFGATKNDVSVSRNSDNIMVFVKI